MVEFSVHGSPEMSRETAEALAHMLLTAVASKQPPSELERYRTALRIIAGYEQCIDNLMSNVDIARAALSETARD